MAEGTDWICMADSQPVGGVFDMHQPKFEGVPANRFADSAVADVDARLAKVQAGGKVVRPPFDVPNVGGLAEPDRGATIGWMTPVQRSRAESNDRRAGCAASG